MIALAATHAAMPAPADLPGLRTSLDSDTDARLRRPAQPKRPLSTQPEPVGQIPSYGLPPGSGAGKTGFVSTPKSSKTKARATATKAAGPALMPLSRSGMVARAAAALAGKSPSPPPAGAAAPARAGARPVVAPRPPALAHREEAKEELRARPNTVVAVPRRPEEDPFEQVGMRAGAFLLRPAIETFGGYDSNPGRVRGGKGSAFIAPGGELQVRSDWVRHEVVADIRGSYTAYQATPELDTPNLAARLAGRIDVSERTRALLEGRYSLAGANPGLPGLPAGLAELPIVQTVGATAGAVRRFNRLELALKGTFDRTEWDDSKLTDGSIIRNKDRDYNQYGVQTRASYELTPGVKPFVDVAVDTRDYDLPIDAGGVARSSDEIGRASCRERV